jgi:hypothetical protein
LKFLERLLVFYHPKFKRCCRMDNQANNHWADHHWANNHQAINLTKTFKTSYPTHHLVFTPPNLWIAHPQPCINERLQKCPVVRTLHWRKHENVKSLKIMILNKLPHNNSRKLSWHFLWSTQWHLSMVLLWANKELA